MRKSIYFIFLICIALTSCSKDTLYNDIHKESNKTPIILELSNFNDSLLRDLPQTRISNGQFLDRTSVVVADAIGAFAVGKIGAEIGGFFGHPHVGAIIGGLVGGAYSSYKCYRALHSTRVLNTPIVSYQPLQVAAAYVPALENSSVIQDNIPKQINFNYSKENEAHIEFGAKHNVIVSNLLTNNFALDSEVNKMLSKEEIEILNSDEFIAGYDSVVNNLTTCIINRKIPQSTDQDISSLLMNLFAHILATYPEQAEDVEFIINKYIDAVQRTPELSSDEKDNIYHSLSVAASSFEYWNAQ